MNGTIVYKHHTNRIDFAAREATFVINKTTTIIINWLPELVVPLQCAWFVVSGYTLFLDWKLCRELQYTIHLRTLNTYTIIRLEDHSGMLTLLYM